MELIAIIVFKNKKQTNNLKEQPFLKPRHCFLADPLFQTHFPSYKSCCHLETVLSLWDMLEFTLCLLVLPIKVRVNLIPWQKLLFLWRQSNAFIKSLLQLWGGSCIPAELLAGSSWELTPNEPVSLWFKADRHYTCLVFWEISLYSCVWGWLFSCCLCLCST